MFITVHGIPAPQGSKRHVGNGVMVESSKKVKPWRQDVKYAALEANKSDIQFTDVGLNVSVTFFLPRPRGHYRTGRNAHLLRAGAPARPHRKPDIDKLLRSTLDGLGESGVWVDDAQVVSVVVEKVYADHRPPGAAILVQPVTADARTGVAS